ncbi:MAG: AMP-binding protein [Rhodobacteraceae bacterium]|nr:AMP-binding protein [Paracoccaceae bacterium]
MTPYPVSAPGGTVRDWLDEHAGTVPDKVSHVFPGHGSMTWFELRDTADDIARRLTGLGIRRGESVAVMIPNGRAGVALLFGVLYGGFRLTMINIAAGPAAVAHALDHSGARFVFLDHGRFDLLDAARTSVALDVTAVPVDNGTDHSWSERASKLHDVAAGDDALLMYTSGTTGRPKGVLHTHSSLLAGGWTTAQAHELTPEDRAYCVLPIYHINGLCVTILGPLVSGGSVTVCERFSAGRFWQQCGEFEVTWFSAVPTIISYLVHGETEPDSMVRQRIRFGRSASSALSPDVQRSFESRFGIPVIETMGLTEAAAQILSNPLPPGRRKLGSPGIAYGNSIAILSPEFVPLPPGQEGEIAVRGPNVMRGYFRDPVASAESRTEDGWLRTGDLGTLDDDGYVFVTGRLKELIIKGGENIAPREIDETLYAHPDVVEAAAFPRTCERYGERVEAAVKLRSGTSVSAGQLMDMCRERLGEFKSPDRIFLLDELPKGPSGKIQRLKLASLTGEDRSGKTRSA